jgi:AcrR family transcriptional regulator
MARRSDHSRQELHRLALAAARKIVQNHGLRELSTRRIAKGMGYTAGTLYQLFEDLDDLIIHLNAETLEALYHACERVNFDAEPEIILQDLAERYIAFVGQNSKLWTALFEHNLPSRRKLPKWYELQVNKLLNLADRALLPLFPLDSERRLHEAHVLWASLYGIASLASADKLARAEPPQQLVRSLIANYLAGLRVPQSQLSATTSVKLRESRQRKLK